MKIFYDYSAFKSYNFFDKGITWQEIHILEKYIDKDHRIGEHVKIRIGIFQQQMVYLSLLLGFIGFFVLLFFKELKKKDFYILKEYHNQLVIKKEP